MSARQFVQSITTSSAAPLGRITAVSKDTLAIADLPGTGTPSSSTYLRGDGIWATITTGTGTVTSVNLTAPAAGITVSGGPVTTSGSITLALADDLAALEALSGTNTIYYRSAANTWTAVTIGTGMSFTGGTLACTVTPGTGTVTSVGLTGPTAGISVTGSPVTGAGSITLALADDLAALEALSGTNTIYYRSAANTWTAVTIGTGMSFTGGTLACTVTGALPRGYIDGFTLSRATGSPTNTIAISAGKCRSDGDAVNMELAGPFEKILNNSVTAWTAGSGQSGLDGGARNASTWYHVFVIATAAGVYDALVSTSATAPTMPGAYVYKRRIGSFRTDGSFNIIDFVQRPGGEFFWLTPVSDVIASNPGTSAVTRTLTVPTGVRVKAVFSVLLGGSTAADNPGDVYFSDLSLTDTAANQFVLSIGGYNGGAVTNQVGGIVQVWTNTSAQIRSRAQISGSGTGIWINTHGWIDPRGQNA